MLVSVHRIYKNGRQSKPLETYECQDLDQAEKIWEEQYRWKFPEHWTIEFQNMEMHDPVFQLLAKI